MRLTVIDTETTGLDAQVDKVCEIAGVDVDERGNVQSSWSSFVNPGFDIPPKASAIHHIIDSDVVTANDIRTVIAPVLEDPPGYYVAHNARFEQSMLPELHPWICTYKCAVQAYPDAPEYSLQFLRYYLGLHEIEGVDRHGPSHRALPDAFVTAALFNRLRLHLEIEEMSEISLQPVVLPRFPFGKHAGELVKDLPAGYLRWIIKKGTFDEDVVHTANYWLNDQPDMIDG